MPIPRSWVNELFGRLSVRYGNAFMAQYKDMDMDAVKDDWAEVLGGFYAHPKAIAYGLEQLGDKPPHCTAFRDLCRPALRDERQEVPALPAPAADPARVRAIVTDALTPANDKRSLNRIMLDNLRAIEARGMRLTIYQRDAIKACEAHEITRGPVCDMPGAFKPVPRELWPQAMREGLPA